LGCCEVTVSGKNPDVDLIPVNVIKKLFQKPSNIKMSFGLLEHQGHPENPNRIMSFGLLEHQGHPENPNRIKVP